MIKKDEIKQFLGDEIQISDSMCRAIKLWDDMYQNNADWLCDNVSGLNLPAAISSEIARCATIEMRACVRSSNKSREDFLNKSLQEVVSNMRTQIEYGCALGGLIFKPFVAGGKLCVDYVKANCFFPTEFDNSGKIVSAVFVDQKKIGDKFFTRIENHKMTSDGIIIKNSAFCSDSEFKLGKQILLSSVDCWSNLQQQVLIKGVKQPLFAYFKAPFANNVDSSSNLGVSVFSKASSLIRQADEQFARLLWEFEASEYAVYVDELAIKPHRDLSGKITGYNIPQKQKRIFKGLSVGANSEEFFKEWAPVIRDQSLINGLNEILCRIEDVCGLARGTFSNSNQSAKTATELKILRQRSFSTICDTQKSIKNALDELVCAMDNLTTLYNLAPLGDVQTSYEFDDSIVTDRQSEFAEKKQLCEMGIMKPWELRAWYFGETNELSKNVLDVSE